MQNTTRASVAVATPLAHDCLLRLELAGALTRKEADQIAALLHADVTESSLPPVVVVPAGAVAAVLGAIALMGSTLGLLAWWRWKPRPLRVFLSYRVAADADLASALYERLTEAGIDAWLDKECLPKGKSWEEGFANGLFSSAIFLPLMSQAALASFADLSADTAYCDNVLLECASRGPDPGTSG